jgi:hypothetical protein
LRGFTGLLEDLHGGLIHLQDIVGQHLIAQEVDQGLDEYPEPNHPEGQGRARDIDADALEDFLLSVER